MLQNTYVDQLIARCRAVTPGINDYFEEQRYLTAVDNIEEVTPQYLLNTAVSLVLDHLDEMGLTSNFSVEELLESTIDLETMFYLATKFDGASYYQLLRSLDERFIAEYAATLENIDIATDYLFDLTEFFTTLFPTDIGWDYINRGTEFWFSNEQFVAHIVGIQSKLELSTDPNPIVIPEDDLTVVKQFMEHMVEREQKVKLYADYICNKYSGLVSRSKLFNKIKRYDKEKLDPSTILLFAKWGAIPSEAKAKMSEPEFLRQHHLSDDHHFEHWEQLKKSGNIPEGGSPLFTYEVAIMVVISLVLDDLDHEELHRQVVQFKGIPQQEVYEFMLNLLHQVPFNKLTGGE